MMKLEAVVSPGREIVSKVLKDHNMSLPNHLTTKIMGVDIESKNNKGSEENTLA